MSTTSSSSSTRLRYTLVLVAGIVLGAGLTMTLGDEIFRSNAIDEDDAVGTFLPPKSLERLDLIGHETFEAGDLSGAIEMRSGRGMALMEVVVESDAPGLVEVRFDEQALSPRGFSQENPAGEILYQGDHYRFVTAGQNRYQLTFRTRAEASTIRLRFQGQGAEQEIEMPVGPSH